MTLPALGRLLANRYRLDRVLGTGGSGTVFRATDEQLGRAVALKLMTRADATPDLAARFEREARVGAALAHPHVVQTLDFGRAEQTLFLVTQLVEGGDLLRFHLEHVELPIEVAIAIGSQIADALAAAHALGLVHRDLKPENVLIERRSQRPWAYVSDFGLAYLIAPADPKQARLTLDDMVSGTPPYMSPEQISDGAISTPTDIYSFGCLLYELLVGFPPFGGTQGKLFAAHLYAPPKPPRAVRPEIPGALDELVLRMLAKPPGDRPTALVVKHRLATLAAGGSSTERSDAGILPGDRRNRMITDAPPLAAQQRARPVRPRIAITGDEPPSDLLAALAMVDMEVVPLAGAHDACVAIGVDLPTLGALAVGRAPVIADADAADFARITQLLRLGIAEVVMRPLVPATVVSKIQRTLRRGR